MICGFYEMTFGSLHGIPTMNYQQSKYMKVTLKEIFYRFFIAKYVSLNFRSVE